MHDPDAHEAGACSVVKGRSFRVVGVAVTAAARPYPDVCFAPECSWFAEAMEDEMAEGPPPEPPPDEPPTTPRSRSGRSSQVWSGSPRRTPAVSPPPRDSCPTS